MSIRLWIKCCAKVNTSTKTLLKWLLEIRGKLRTSIWDDRKRNTMKPQNFIHVKLSIVLYESVVLTAKKWEDLVILSTVSQKESCCVRVRGNLVMKSIFITSHFQVGMSISWVIPLVSDALPSHAWIGVLTHKIFYIPLHTIPPKDFPHIAIHICGAWMNRISRVVGFCKNLLSQLTHIRNTQSTLVAKYTISPLGKNLHSLIVECTIKFKQDCIHVLLFLNLLYHWILCAIINCYNIVLYS